MLSTDLAATSDGSKGLGVNAYFTRFAFARRQHRLTTANHFPETEAPRRRWLDRLPLAVVVMAGIVLGVLGGVGFFYLEAPGWVFFWLTLFAALGWLGYTAAPVFEEDNPVRTPTEPRRVKDGELVMVDLPGGRFLMGSPDSDDMARDNEKPQHEVTIGYFRIGVTPVTVELYRAVMSKPSSPGSETEGRQPITDVTWYDAIEFCNRLSQRAGYRPCYVRRFGRWRCDWRADGYRLPTEAEWEYACRAGTTTRYFFSDDPAGLDAYAWYDGNTNTVQPVATKRANPWGLYDMHGNVWEWCWDRYGPYSPAAARNPRGPTRSKSEWRVVRGGSFVDSPLYLRSALRGIFDPERRSRRTGFRCVRVPPQHVDALSD
ncbi:MAG: formylglycine-generating enzyme family protein [Candidatus Competibacteraceae bacterium]